MPQLGTVERGENMKIGTYVESSVDHELSANIIDLCPVGALNNKPYRYSARAWEMMQRATIAPHDCVGSNLYAHVLRGTVKRVVPRENESINETWISDRDRFSYEAIYSKDRLLTPRLKQSGSWRDIDWDEALQIAADRLRGAAADKLGVLASPSATLEESHLVARLAEHLGSNNIDHRISRRDVSDQQQDPVFPWLGCEIGDIEKQQAIFLVGSQLRHEAPILAHRVRKAAVAGASVSIANEIPHEYFFRLAQNLSGNKLVSLLGGVAAAAGGDALPPQIADLCAGAAAGETEKAIVASLTSADEALVLLGNIAIRDASYAAVRVLAAFVAEKTGAKLGYVSEGANSAGSHLAGVLPHRGSGGLPRTRAGRSATTMLDEPLDAVVLLNVEPDCDLHAVDDPVEKLSRQNFVVSLTPFVSEALLETADLLLPVGTFAETSGTYVNAAGTWQSFAGIANPVGQSRPAWKVLRVIGNLVEAPGFDFVSSEEIRDHLHATLGDIRASNLYSGADRIASPGGNVATGGHADIPLYSVDGLVRRASALQRTPAAQRAAGVAGT
jgi:NADH-quinone oxidoreductase subunit G